MVSAKAVFGIAATAAFLFLAAWNVDVGKVAAAAAGADPWLLVLASCVYMGSFPVRGARWKEIVRRKKRVGIADSSSYATIGWAANNVLPARAGELVRAHVSGKREGIGTSFSLATILVERFMDVLALITLLFLVAMLSAVPAWAGMTGAVAALLLLCAAAAALMVARGMIAVPRKLSFLRGSVQSFSAGLSVMDGKAAAAAYVLSLLVWALEGAVFYIVGVATGIGVGLIPIFFVLCIVNLGITIPSSPGYIGTFQFFAVLALGALAVDASIALAFAVLVHGVEYIPVTFAGAVLFYGKYAKGAAHRESGKR